MFAPITYCISTIYTAIILHIISLSRFSFIYNFHTTFMFTIWNMSK